MRPTTIALIICIVLASCKTDSANENQGNLPNSNALKPSYLQGMYATSTRLPYSRFDVRRVFDGNDSTYWSTMRGAGPDEGFVLYFQQPTTLKHIVVRPANAENLAEIRNLALYLDGHLLDEFKPNDTLNIDRPVTTLFVKVISTALTSLESVTSESEEDEMALEEFDRNNSVGIAEVELFGDQGRLNIIPPDAVTGTVIASSVLKPHTAYQPAQLFDARKEFVWAEGSPGLGKDEVLTFTFNAPQTISSVKIWNGYQRSEKHFEANARAKSIEIGAKGGAKAKYTIEDTMTPQMIVLQEPINSSVLEIKILDVFPGSTYKDLALSEILFYNGEKPLQLADSNVEEAHRVFVNEVKGSILEQYLDRRLYNRTVKYSISTTRSLILRSNKTFVLYESKKSYGDTAEEDEQIVADGGWEVIEQDDVAAKIRVFGKLFNLSETLDYYQGNSSVEVIKIFQDNLNITADNVWGEKVIDEFYTKLPETIDL